jgi:hypothetical protein
VDRFAVWLYVAKAARVLGWRPGTPLADGVAAMWHAMVRPGHLERVSNRDRQAAVSR